MFNAPDQIKAAFLAAIPTEFLPAVLKALFQSYRDALEMCEGHMGAAQTIDVLSVNRRAIFETNLKRVGQRLKQAGAEATTEMNVSKTSRFSLVKFGAIYVTAARSNSYKNMPRAAKYRTNLFETGQVSLFAAQREVQREEGNDDASLYAILLHGAPAKKRHPEDPTNLAFPSFARVVFPDQTGKIVIGIDLFTEITECRDVVNEFIPPAETVPAGQPKPRRERQPKVAG